MESNTQYDVKSISKTLYDLTTSCASLDDYLDVAFDFRYKSISITPLQKKNEILTLLEVLSQNRPKKLMEIGTSNGGTLFLLCKVASDDAEIISIDLPEGPYGGKMYPDWKVPFYETFASTNQKIHLLRSDSHEEETKTQCNKILKNKLLDFLLIDGDHSYVGIKKDFEMYMPLVRDGGIIAFHDISNGPIENVGGVGKFWEEIKKQYNCVEIIDNTNDEGYGIGLILISREKNNLDFQQILHTVNKNQNKIIMELQSTLRISKLEFIQHPITAILTLYSERPDLQQAFPEVSQGQLQNLILWASEVNSDNIKEEIISKKILSKFSNWYAEFSTNNIKENEEKQNSQNLLVKFKNETESLRREKIDLSNTNQFLHQEKNYLSKINEYLHQEQINVLKAKKNLEEKLITLNEKITIDTKHINSLTFEISRFQKELELIKSSFSFKTIRLIGSNIDKIFKKKKIINDIKATAFASKKTIESEGVKSFINHAKDKIRNGELLLQSQSYNTISIKPPTNNSILSFDDLDEKDLFPPKFFASVIIPTRSDELQIKTLIENINSQLGFKNLKIIIVNSGNNLLHTFNDFPNITILSIKPEEFSHGKVRNIGISESQGDYVFFISDDILLASNHIFYDMCNVFLNDEKIAATSVRQIPRSDSDLMAIYSLHEYYQSLDLTHDRIVFTDNFDNLNPIQKRGTAQIDDVCSCYKFDIISKYQFGKVKYAEDLDIGVRLIQDGYKISQLFSKGVIHSHKRPASYYLKRHFVETRILSNLLNYHTFDYKKRGILSVQDITDQIFSLYNSLNLTIQLLQKNNYLDISQIFNTMKKEIPINYSIKVETKNSNQSLDQIFQQFHQPQKLPHENFLLEDYLAALIRFENFLKNLYLNISGLDEDFYDTLYKLFAVIVGDRLGGFSLQTQNQTQDKELEKITTLLESGI